MIHKNKYRPFLYTAIFTAGFFIFSGATKVFANPQIISTTLNGSSQNITFNPSAGGSVSIQVKANEAVKFTRLYICSVSQICNGTSGNYTKYFTQTTISDTIDKSWDGKASSGATSSEGEYKIFPGNQGTDGNGIGRRKYHQDTHTYHVGQAGCLDTTQCNG